MKFKLGTFWVNQPSTLQPDHKNHGRLVHVQVDAKHRPIANDGDGITHAYFLDAPYNSSKIFISSLSLHTSITTHNKL